MRPKSKLFKIMILLLGVVCFAACSSSESSENDSEYLWGNTGSESTTMSKDVPMSDMETFIEYAVKVENLKLQTIKAFSNNWKGELLCCELDNVNPDKIYDLITELLENQSRYKKAVNNLEKSGVLSNVTTRGPVVNSLDYLDYLSGICHDDEQLIKDALEKGKMMGDKKAQNELFELLAGDGLQNGCKNAQEWFIRFNNGEFTIQASKIKRCWCTEAQGDPNKRAQETFYYNICSITGDHPVWGAAAKAGAGVATKGMNITLSTLDQLSGGAISNLQYANDVVEEVNKIRQKYKDGTLKSSDFNKINTMIEKNLLDKFFGKILPEEAKSLSDESLLKIKDELNDYVDEKLVEKAEEEAAKGKDWSILDIFNNSGSSVVGVVCVNNDTGEITLGLPNKEGNVPVLTNANQNHTVTTVTKEGKRSTQRVKPKAGKDEINAEPAPSDVSYKINPEYLDFDVEGGRKAISVTSNVKHFGAKTNEKWIEITQVGTNVIVDVEKNETDKERSGFVTIVLSQDKNNVLASVNVPITQRAETEETPLTFINTESLMIQKIETDLLPQRANMILSGNQKSTIYPENISVVKISDYLYQVRAHYDDPMAYNYDNVVNPNAIIDETKPYGLYYDISFYIESIETFQAGDHYNMMARDIEISGYHKDLEKDLFTKLCYDDIVEFNATISRADLLQGKFNPNGSAEFSTTTTQYWGVGYSVNSTSTNRLYYDDGGYDSNGNWVSNFKMMTNKRQSKGDEIFQFQLKW